MKKTTSTLLVLVLVVPLMFTLSGCAENYTQSDVERYVREDLGIKEFTVADEPVVKKNVRGSDSNYWTVTTDWYGLDQPLTFEVEDFCMTDDIPHCGLKGDPSDAIDEAIARMYHPSGKLKVHQIDNDDGTRFGGWYYPVSSRADFEASWSEIQKFQKFLQDYPRISDHPFTIFYEVKSADEVEQRTDAFLSPYTIEVKADFTHQDFLNKLYVPEAEYSDDLGAVEKYLEDSLEYGLRNHIKDFSDEEIARIANMSSLMIPLRDADGKLLDPTVVYYKESIPYGHLFQLAKTAGLKVEGSWVQFEVQGADGQTRTFSYEYKKGDYRVPSVTREEAEQILGFPLDDSQDSDDVTVSAETLAYVEVTPEELIDQVEAHADGRKVSTEIIDGAVRIHAEKGVLGSVEDAYDEEVRNLEEQVRQASGSHFYVNVSHNNIDKFDVRLELESKKDVTGENAERVKRIVQLMYLNRQLDSPSEKSFVVSVAKSKRDAKSTELAVINVPKDKLDFSNIWR